MEDSIEVIKSKYSFSEDEIKLINPKTALNINIGSKHFFWINVNVFYLNIGVLGHIDSGKTSIAKALSVITSTASMDKNPQS